MASETRGRINFASSPDPELKQLEGHEAQIRHYNSITYHVKDDMIVSITGANPLKKNISKRRGEDILLTQQPQQSHQVIQEQLTVTVAPEELPPVQFNIFGHMQMIKPLASESPNSLKLFSQTTSNMDHQILSNSKPQRHQLHSQYSGSTDLTISTTTKTLQLTGNSTPKQNTNSSSSDSPLDFSFATKKAKLGQKAENPGETDSEIPCSRLRDILIMKSPDLSEDVAGTVLNLSKAHPSQLSPILGCNSNSIAKSIADSPNLRSRSSSGSASTSCSPVLSTPIAFAANSSQSTSTQVPISMPHMHTQGTQGGGGNMVLPMTFSPFGSFSPNLSPILSHTIPSSGGLSLPFDSQPFYSQHMIPGNGNSALGFGTGLSLPTTSLSIALANGNLNNRCNNATDKVRVTRPFKAYPKDPMTFPTVGMYGMPLNTMSGTSESILHQQSNRAYADFRKQMLSRGQAKSRRGGQRNISLQTLADVNSLSTEPLRYDLDLIEPGAMSSGAEDSHSNSEEGYNGGKIGSTKSERQGKDEAYWERRRKNNEAAKRSRDARRAKEDEIAIRAVFLEQENMKLRLELCNLRNETAKLRSMLYSNS